MGEVREAAIDGMMWEGEVAVAEVEGDGGGSWEPS